MVISAEKAKILEMVESGQVSAQDGARLLGALKQKDETGTSASEQPTRWLHVRVSDLYTGRLKVNVNVPIELMKAGLRFGSQFAPEMEDFDVDGLVAELASVGCGRLVEVEHEDAGARVEVCLD